MGGVDPPNRKRGFEEEVRLFPTCLFSFFFRKVKHTHLNNGDADLKKDLLSTMHLYVSQGQSKYRDLGSHVALGRWR